MQGPCSFAWKSVQAFIAALLLLDFVDPTRALAVFDLTGRWEIVELDTEVDLHQSGTSLLLFFVFDDVPAQTGTIDTDTGSFSISAPSSASISVATAAIGFVIDASGKMASFGIGVFAAASRYPNAS